MAAAVYFRPLLAENLSSNQSKIMIPTARYPGILSRVDLFVYILLSPLHLRSKHAMCKSESIDPKRRAAGVKLKLDFLSFLRAEMSEEVRERWMQRRALMRADRFTVEQRRELREW